MEKGVFSEECETAEPCRKSMDRSVWTGRFLSESFCPMSSKVYSCIYEPGVQEGTTYLKIKRKQDVEIEV